MQADFPTDLAERIAEAVGREVTRVLALHASRDEAAFNLRDAAARLGISQRSLWTRANRGEVPSAKIGTRRVFRRAALEAWIEALEQKGRGPRSASAARAMKSGAGNTPEVQHGS